MNTWLWAFANGASTQERVKKEKRKIKKPTTCNICKVNPRAVTKKGLVLCYCRKCINEQQKTIDARRRGLKNA